VSRSGLTHILGQAGPVERSSMSVTFKVRRNVFAIEASFYWGFYFRALSFALGPLALVFAWNRRKEIDERGD
jgi:peptidoglycan/LPS O-acetylase OafA/YrhL